MVKIAIIDYGTANLRSIKTSLEEVGSEIIVTDERDGMINADAIVLPGVDAFEGALKNLETISDVILDQIEESKHLPSWYLHCEGSERVLAQAQCAGSAITRASQNSVLELVRRVMYLLGVQVQHYLSYVTGVRDSSSNAFYYEARPDSSRTALAD